MSYFVYIIQSLKDDRFYIGSTSDVEQRLKAHNTGQTRYTKKFRPWVLKHFEEYGTRSEAVRREKYLKSPKNVKIFLESLTLNSVG